jgi:site-specific DNA recombinase
VQERLARNKAFSSRNAKRCYLLSGLVRCERCGARPAGASSKGYRYYRCTHRGTRYGDGPMDPADRCDAPWTQADWLEDAVWTRVAGLFRDPERLRAELEQRQQEGSPTRTTAEQELAGLRARLAALPREQDWLLGAFAKGHVPEDALGRQMDGLQKERLAAQQRAANLERELAALALSEKQQADAVEYAASIAAGLDGLDDEGRKQFLQDMVREVRVDGRRVVIRTILSGRSDGGGSGGGGCLALHPVQQHRLVAVVGAPVSRQPMPTRAVLRTARAQTLPRRERHLRNVR